MNPQGVAAPWGVVHGLYSIFGCAHYTTASIVYARENFLENPLTFCVHTHNKRVHRKEAIK